MHCHTKSLLNWSCFRYGSDRSSLYVGLSILVQQIKRESRCDVFTAVRKLRAQRQAMVQSLVTFKNVKTYEYPSYGQYSQTMYEFLYRAISDYVDLYKNKDEEYEYSVPVGVVQAVQANGTTKVGSWRWQWWWITFDLLVRQVNPVIKIIEVKWLRALLCPCGLKRDGHLQVLWLRHQCQLIQGQGAWPVGRADRATQSHASWTHKHSCLRKLCHRKWKDCQWWGHSRNHSPGIIRERSIFVKSIRISLPLLRGCLGWDRQSSSGLQQNFALIQIRQNHVKR